MMMISTILPLSANRNSQRSKQANQEATSLGLSRQRMPHSSLMAHTMVLVISAQAAALGLQKVIPSTPMSMANYTFRMRLFL